MKRRRTVCVLASIAILMIGGAIWAYAMASSYYISGSMIEKVHVGMPKKEIERIWGKPHIHVHAGGDHSCELWHGFEGEIWVVFNFDGVQDIAYTKHNLWDIGSNVLSLGLSHESSDAGHIGFCKD